MIGRFLAWLFIALGVGVFAYDVWVFLNNGAVRLTALGQLWYWIHPGSLNLLQAGVERHLTPFLWDPIIINVLLLPASVLFLAIGIVFGLIFRRRKRRRR